MPIAVLDRIIAVSLWMSAIFPIILYSLSIAFMSAASF
jgi:hypothetical protein